MISNYVTKVEDRYVFNVSLIFWHTMIALATVVLIVGVSIFMWSVLPTLKREVPELVLPPEPTPPAPISIALGDLAAPVDMKSKVVEQENPIPASRATNEEPIQRDNVVPPEDVVGAAQYTQALIEFKRLLPQNKEVWEGAGHWTYPQGKRFWDVYQEEKYRKWVATEVGMETKLEQRLSSIGASQQQKTEVVNSINRLLALCPESERLTFVNATLQSVGPDVQSTIARHSTIYDLFKTHQHTVAPSMMKQLSEFQKSDPVAAKEVVESMIKFLGRCPVDQQRDVVEYILNSNISQFKRNSSYQNEALILFDSLSADIAPIDMLASLKKFSSLYIQKNQERINLIDQQRKEYERRVQEVRSLHESQLAQIRAEELMKEESKDEFRIKPDI
jgi:hypothetical protein